MNGGDFKLNLEAIGGVEGDGLYVKVSISAKFDAGVHWRPLVVFVRSQFGDQLNHQFPLLP